MISIDCSHPDLEEFIEVKNDLTRVTKANISVRVNDDFMNAVINDLDWELYFKTEHGDEMRKVVKAKEIFRLLSKNNWSMAEPGILFWDRIENYNLLSEDENFKYAGVNPCFTGDMRLLTINGFKTFEELNNTEPFIYSYDGKISQGKVWCNGEKETIKLILSNGKEITCTPDHRFMTIDGNECMAKDLKDKKIMPRIYKTIDDNELYIRLGFIQGDGQLSRLDNDYHDGLEVNIGSKDGDIKYLFENTNYTIKSYREIYLKGYNDMLRNMGFSDKNLPYRTMPLSYDSWNKENKANFLQGCFSANGCVNSNLRVSYKTTCKEFALELIETLKNDFNITANITVNKKHMTEFNNGEYECRESYDVNINKYDDIIRFAETIGFYQNYKKVKLINLIKERVPYVRNIKENGKRLVYDFKEPINHWGVVEGFVAHNCAEEPLPEGGSCLLGSINLAAYVKNREFDFEEFLEDMHVIVKGMNDVLDEGLPLHPLQIQRETVRDWRQIGIGIMGLADMLIKLGIQYDTKEAQDFCNKLGFTMANEAIYASAELASEHGAYPMYNEKVLESEFIKNNTTMTTYEAVKQYGLRNSQILTIAPCGTLSTMLGISGGIEPIFSLSYTRKTESLHGEDRYYKVFTPIADEYMKKHNLKEEEELPEFFVTAQNINPYRRVEMQGIWQDHIDASISSTLNLPNETTVEEVEQLYIHAWEKGLKGMTIFRDGCDRAAILTTGNKKEEKSIEVEESKNEPARGVVVPTSDDVIGLKRKLTGGCGSLHLQVYFDRTTGKMTEVFVNKGGSGGCNSNLNALSRMISIALRAGVDVKDVADQLGSTINCPSFASSRAKGINLSPGSSCAGAVGKALIDLNKEFQVIFKVMNNVEEEHVEIVNPDKNMGLKECPECKEKTLQMSGGCMQCSNCGYSKCD